jgi:hypothetical protein
MATVDTLRNNLIDKLLTISNKDYLQALNQLIESSAVEDNAVSLTEEQILILHLSDKDIAVNRLITQEQLDKRDLQWLKEQ